MFSKIFIPGVKNNYYPYSIRKPALVAYVLILFLINMFGGLLIPGFTGEVAASSITSSNIIALTNSERKSHSLNTLNPDARLAAAAQAKAYDMLEKDYWDHFGPNGETPWQFISAAGYTYVYAGENLAKGFSTAEGVHQAWMASPTHRANILNGNYRDIGIAVVQGELAGENIVLVVQMFGSLTADVPAAPPPTPTTPVPKETAPVPVKEKGEIKSISISRPQADAVVTDPSVDVEGSVAGYESNIGSYQVDLTREGEQIASTTSKGSDWVINKASDWEQGEHSVRVTLKGSPNISDDVVFNIDSKPPQFEEGSVSILFNGEHAEVSIFLQEEDSDVYLNVGSETYAFTHDSDGVYLAYVPQEVVNEGDVSGVLIVSDPHGNSTEMDISERFDDAKKMQNLETVASQTLLQRVFSGLSSLSRRGKINIAAGLLLLSLLVFQVYQYKKKKRLSDKSGYLMTVGVFLFIVLVGLFTEVTGSIN